MLTPRLQRGILVKKEAMQEGCRKLQNCCRKFVFSTLILCRWRSLTKHIFVKKNSSMYHYDKHGICFIKNPYPGLILPQVNTTITLNECNLISMATQTTGPTTQTTGSTTGSMTGQVSTMGSTGQTTTMQSPTVESSTPGKCKNQNYVTTG